MSSSRALLRAVLATTLLAAAAVSADWGLTRLIARSPSLDAARIMRLASGAGRDDIPVLGASKVAADYLPDRLGPRFHAYGFASASQDVSNLLLDMALDHPSTQPVIIDFLQFALTDSGDDRNFLPLTGRADVRAVLKRSGKWRWYYGIPGLRYFGAWDTYVAGLVTDLHSETVRMVQGHAYNLRVAPRSEAAFQAAVAKRLRTRLEWHADAQQVRDLDALVARAGARKIVLVLSPLHRTFWANATGEAAYRRVLDSLQRRHRNLVVLDFTRAPYPDSLFADTAHLTPEGAERFSAELRTALVRAKVLPEPAGRRGPRSGGMGDPGEWRALVQRTSGGRDRD